MSDVFDLHAQTLSTLREAAGDGPLPAPPSGFIRAWVEEAVSWAEPARGREVVAHYAQRSPEAWVRRFYGGSAPVTELVRLDLRQAEVPRLRAALAALFAGARAAGLSPESVWGVPDVAAWLEARPRILDLHAGAFFGCCQPMISLGPLEQAALEASVDAGWGVASWLDVRLAGHVVHEQAHGPARAWRGGPGSWILHEAAGAVVNHAIRAEHVFARRPGEPVLGLRHAMVLGQAMIDAVGEAAVWRLALAGADPTAEIGRRSGHALAAADWQIWCRSDRLAFMPSHRRMLSWAKLFEVSRTPSLCPELDRLEDAARVTPDLALGLPDLHDLADAVPWTQVPAWHSPLEVSHREGLRVAVASMFQVERMQPDLQAVPADPPGGVLRVDVGACALRAEVRRDGAHGLAAVWRLPPPLCRALASRGLAQLTIRRASLAHEAEIVDRLWDLAHGTRGLPADHEVAVGPAARGDRTEVVVAASSSQLHHVDPVVAVGSCFAGHIGERLARDLFDVHLHPFGILYDPVSVSRATSWVCRDTPLPESLWFFAHGRWHSPLHHTDLSHPDKAHAVSRAQRLLSAARTVRGRSSWLWTWGTAWVWEDAKTGEVVANCHGLPESRFRRRLLSVDEVVQQARAALDVLRAQVREAQVVLTVSPIRHLSHGVTDNQRSKATLLLAATALAEAHAEVRYFPAYEIVVDELRDYRWYDPDLVHVTPVAADQVYARFLDAHVAPASRDLARAVAVATHDLVAVPRDPVRRARRLEVLREALADLPRAPALPWPHRTQVGVDHALRAARALWDGDAPDPVPVEVLVTTPTTPPPAEVDLVQDYREALELGRYIAWDRLEAWASEVSTAGQRVVDAGGDNRAAWASLEALLDKVDELEDASEVVAPLAGPLVQMIAREAARAGSRASTAQDLATLLCQHVPRGHVVWPAEVGVDVTDVADALEARLRQREASGRTVSPLLRELLGRLRVG
jgi:hypothetical protein